MTGMKLAGVWALTLLISAFAARLGFLGSDVAEGLFFALVAGASVSLARASRCGDC